MSAVVQKHAIGQLCEFVKGTSPTLKTEPGEYPLVVTAAFRRTSADWQIEGPAVCVPLVSSTGHGDAALHRVHFQDGKFALANLLVALIPRDPTICDAKYLYHLLQAQKDDLFVPLMLGTANVSLKERDIASVEIPLPSLAEQRRIVARIEELAAKVGETRALRAAASDEVFALSRAATDKIYGRLRSEIGVSRLDTACTSITDGDHLTPAFSESGVKFIFVGNVSTSQLHFNGVKYVTPEYFQRLSASRVPRRGDVLYSAVGATLGIPAVVDVDDEFCFQRHVAILKPDRAKALSRFLWHMLRSKTVFDKAWASTTGSAQPTIPLRGIRELPIPLPSLNCQSLVVAELDALQARVDSVKALQSETAAELDAMLPAILDKAFKGEL